MTAPPAAHVAALASLPEVGPARLGALLRRGEPAAVLLQLATGAFAADADLVDATGRSDPRPLVERWASVAATIDVDELWRRHVDAGVAVLVPGDEGWPAVFDDDPDPPAVLFARGDVGLLAGGRPAVAVVGTRRCTRYGWDVAHQLGVDLADAGACVVSGLAKGIDAAAHRGALDTAGAPPIGIVGTGLDVVYPPSSRPLWREVAAAGVLVSEAPLGTRPARWRFPARNRLLAAVAGAVVVVESAGSGGALHTVDEAVARDRPVLAVPGPITSPASAGSNRLLRDVAGPLCDVDDALATVGLPPRSTVRRQLPPPAACDAPVLEAVGWVASTLDAVAAASRLPLGATAAALARLEASGHVVAAGPGTWCRALGVAR
jgi:DNA processing protein